MYKVKIGDETMTYGIANATIDTQPITNQLPESVEFPLTEGDVLKGKILSVNETELTLELSKNNTTQTITLQTKATPDLKENDAVLVSVISYTKDELKLSITKLSNEAKQVAQNHNPITHKVNMDEIKKIILETNNPLQYSKQLEQHISNTITQVEAILESFSDEDLSVLMKENYDISKMTIDLLYQVGHSPRIDKKIALTGAKNLELSITVDDQAIQQLIDEGIKTSSMVKIPEVELKKIMEELVHNDIEPTLKNVEKVYRFIEKVDKVKDIDTKEIIQFLSSNKESTMGDLYKSLFVSKSREKSNVMSEKDYATIQEDVEAIIKTRFDIKTDIDTDIDTDTVSELESLYTMAKTIVMKGLALDERALDVISFVKKDTTFEVTMDIAIDQIKRNRKPEDYVITKQQISAPVLSKDEVLDVISTIKEATSDMIEELKLEEKPITIKELSQKIASLPNQLKQATSDITVIEPTQAATPINVKTKASEKSTLEKATILTEAISMNSSDRDIENLEILRYQMTFKAAMRLSIEGVDLANTQLEELRQKIDSFSVRFVEKPQEAVLGKDIVTTLSPEQAILEVNRHFSQINSGSTASIANIAVENEVTESLSSIAKKVERGIDRYDQLRTMPRPDLGDRIEKAFSNVDVILDDLSMEVTPYNRRAVEILGRNEMPITIESINSVKVLDIQLQELVQRLLPEHVKELVSQQVDVMTEPIENLLSYVNEKEAKIQVDIQDTVAKSLYQMFKKDELSEEQKNSMLGVYRMIHTIEGSKGAAIGFLLERQLPVTLEALFDASGYLRKARSSGTQIDSSIDDQFGKLVSIEKDAMTIKEQILSGYFEKEKNLNNALQKVIQGGDIDNQSTGENHELAKTIEAMNHLLKGVHESLINEEVEEIRESLDTVNSKQRALIKEGINLSKGEEQSLTLNEWKNLAQMEKDEFAFKPLMDDFYKQVESQDSLRDKFAAALDDLLEDPSREGKQRFEQSIRDLLKEAKETSIKQALETSEVASHQTERSLDATSSKPMNALARDIESHLMLQRNLMKEEYLQIPVMVNGQMQQMNMYFFGKDKAVKAQDDSMSIYFSFSTQHLGTTNIRVQLAGDDMDVSLFSTSTSGNQKVKQFEQEFKDLFSSIGFSVNKLKYESFTVPKGVGQDSGVTQSKQVRKYQESRYEKTV